jgi:Fic family protein
MWDKLNRITEEYKRLSLQDVVDYEKFCIISIMWHSTKIEGCSLSETETKVLLEFDITATGKLLNDHLMIKDHYAAFMFVKQQARAKQKLTVELIQKINALVMNHTGAMINTVLGSVDSSKGDFRLVQVFVGRKYLPDFKKVPALTQKLVNSVNEKIDRVSGEDVLKLASDLHYNFVNIHPFADGNGRTARLLANFVMFYHDEPLIKIFSEDRTSYIDALNETEDAKDLMIFRQFVALQQIKFLMQEIGKYRKLEDDYSFDL